MESLGRDLLPLASPIMEHVHFRFLQHFVEQDVVGHMEADLDPEALALGRLRVTIAFADLAGYTRLTEEAGEAEAHGAVERFVEAVEITLPDEARIVKTIGDEVMIVGPDPATLTDWAVGFQEFYVERPLPRIGVHVRRDALPRRRLLRARGQPRRPGRGARGGRRGARHPARGGGGRLPPRVRPDRRGQAQGLQLPDRAVPRPRRRGIAFRGGQVDRRPDAGPDGPHRARHRAPRAASAASPRPSWPVPAPA